MSNVICDIFLSKFHFAEVCQFHFALEENVTYIDTPFIYVLLAYIHC